MNRTQDYAHESSYFVNVRIGLHSGAFHTRRASDARMSPSEYVDAIPRRYLVEVLVLEGQGWDTVRTATGQPSTSEIEYTKRADSIRDEEPVLASSIDAVVRGMEKQRRESPPEGCVIVEGMDAARQAATDLLQTVVDGEYMDAARGEALDIQTELKTAELPSWD